jgi:hypothetical protein
MIPRRPRSPRRICPAISGTGSRQLREAAREGYAKQTMLRALAATRERRAPACDSGHEHAGNRVLERAAECIFRVNPHRTKVNDEYIYYVNMLRDLGAGAFEPRVAESKSDRFPYAAPFPRKRENPS